jgi:hypothetical protein
MIINKRYTTVDNYREVNNMDSKGQIELVLWLKEQHEIAMGMAKEIGLPEKQLYYVRAKAFEDVLLHIERSNPCSDESGV